MDTIQKARIRPYTTKTQQVYAEGWKMLARVKEFSIKGNGWSLKKEMHLHLTRARRYEFNKLAGEFAAHLQFLYYQIGEKRKAERYSKLAQHHIEIAQVESLAALQFDELVFKLKQTRNPNYAQIKELRNTCDLFRTYLEYPSAQIWIYAYILFNVLAYIEKNYDLVIEQSYKVINYLEKKGIERTAGFYKDMTPALICKGRYSDAKSAIEKAINLIPKSSYPWSVFVYYQLVIELHQSNYENAYQIFLMAEQKRQITREMRDTWKIVRGYLQFLNEADKLKIETKFYLGKFLNDVEVFNSDKSGQNINIILLKILIRLRSDRGRIIDEREAIERYVERYLEKGSRARLFFKMLHQIVPANFKKEVLKTRAEKYLKQMPKGKGYDPDLEIIPYEYLWEMILEQLD